MWRLLLACGDDRSGRLLSSAGSPLAAIPYSSGERAAVTGSDGGYSAPRAGAVTFAYGGLSWTTREVPPELRLPPVRKVSVRCPSEACALTVTWPAAGPLAPEVRRGCAPGDTLALEAPTTLPTASCGDGGRELYVDDRRDEIFLLAPGRETVVRVTAADGGALPADCQVWIDAVPARATGTAGTFVGRGAPGAFAGGRCGGRALPPVAVAGPEVALSWKAAGPALRVADRAPWATDLVILDPVGWTALVHPVDGAFLLPELPAGTYRLELRGPDAAVADSVLLPEPPAGDGVRFAPGGTHVWFGAWRVVTPGQDPPVVE